MFYKRANNMFFIVNVGIVNVNKTSGSGDERTFLACSYVGSKYKTYGTPQL